MRKVMLFVLAVSLSAQSVMILPSRLARTGAVTGQAIVWFSFWTPNVGGIWTDFTSLSQVTIPHNFNTLNTMTVCQNTSREWMGPMRVTNGLNANVIDFDGPTSGRCYVK